MARSKPPSPHEQPRLVRTLEEVGAALERALADGQAMLGTEIGTQETLDGLIEGHNQWSDYLETYLGQVFSTPEISQAFAASRWNNATMAIDDGGRHPDREFRQPLKDQLGNLKSLLNRLPLYGANADVVARQGVERESRQLGKDIFIVHGHDNATKEATARLVQKLGLNPIILHEQPNGGRTLIEKLEQNAARTGFAVVLMTSDDVGAPNSDASKLSARARQNVVLEFGFFVGLIGRSRVATIYGDGVELPSDLLGVVRIALDVHGAWQVALARELKHAGYDVDLNKV